MKTVSAVNVWMALVVMALPLGAADTDSAVKTIDNQSLVEMLNAGIPFAVVEKRMKDNPAVKLTAEPSDLIDIKNAAEKGGMQERERTMLLMMVIDLANRENNRIKELIDRYMNVCINGDKTEYESMMRQILREGKIVGPELRKHIEEENELKRIGVVDALGRVGDRSPLVVKDVRLMLGDRDGGVRESAAQALARLAPPEMVDELIDILDRRSVEHLDGIIQAMGKMGNDKAIKPLTKVLSMTTDAGARQAAARALGELKAKDLEAVNALLDAVLDDQDGELRVLAAEALGRIGEPRAVGYIIRSFQRHEGKSGRDLLLRQLKNFKSLKVVDFLISCVDKDARDIHRAAQETLQILTGADASSREGWEAVREVIRDRPDWADPEANQTTMQR